MRTFTIAPSGPFSLEAAASFGFGQRAATPGAAEMRLAFAVDGFRDHAGVLLRQDEDRSAIEGELHGEADLEAVKRQVARILSLDRDGQEWMAVGERDPVIGRLQREHPGQRPVLFHSPYEAAAWAVLSTRRPRAQAAAARDRIAGELGASFEVGGERMAAFPLPERLLELEPGMGLPAERVARLHGVADAARDGRLDADRLRALDHDEAKAEVQTLRGIGPFYAALVVLRATGQADALPDGEPRVLAYAAHYYGRPGPLAPEELRDLADAWRPFRTWAAVLLRLAGDRAKLPFSRA